MLPITFLNWRMKMFENSKKRCNLIMHSHMNIYWLLLNILSHGSEALQIFLTWYSYVRLKLPPNKKLMQNVIKLFWDEPYLFRICADGIICGCVPKIEMLSVLDTSQSSPVGGHHNGIKTAHKILYFGYYWLTKHQDAHDFTKSCDWCQRDGRILKR